MSSVSKTYTFVGGTDILSAEVNQNFDDLVSYTNTEVIVRDGSKAFTAVPSGPATDPTTANQLTRKQYVDNAVAAVTTSVTSLTTTVTGHTTDLTKRPKVYSQNTSSTALTELTNPKIYTGSFVGTTDANGRLSFVYGTAFTTGVSVVVSNGDESAAAMIVELRGSSTTGWTAQCFSVITTSPFGTPFLAEYANSPVRINYFAVGY